jgi:hypothetical protein
MTGKLTGALTAQIWVRLTTEELRLLEEMTRWHYSAANQARSAMVRRLIREAAARQAGTTERLGT